jgi:transposase
MSIDTTLTLKITKMDLLLSFEKLRVIMSNRDLFVKRLVSSINQLNRWVDVVYPELRQVFKDVKGKGAIATFRLFPTPME